MKHNLFIDSHVHITPPEIIENEEKYRAEEPYFDLLSSSPKNKFVTANQLVEYMEEIGLDRAVVFGFAFRKMDNCRLVNDYTIEAVSRYPEKLIGFAAVNPHAGDVTGELERCRQGGLRGAGELFAEGQGFDMTDREIMQPLCAFCAEHDWPVLIHMNEPVGHYYQGKTGDSIKKGEALAENFPGTTFIYAHWGGGLFFYELMPEMKEKLSNVYYDTAANPFLYEEKIYETVKTMGIINKILLASDYPLLAPSVYREELDKTALSEEDKRLIMGENTRQLLDLS